MTTGPGGAEIQCPDCGGEGKIEIGERRVTREMALDAGDPSMEGARMGMEYGTCRLCDGWGVIEDPGPGPSEAKEER
jgi:hypothetical protein